MNKHYSSVLIALGHNVSRVARNPFFCVWLLLLSGVMHVVSSFLDGMPLGEYIMSCLFIPLLMDTWVVCDTGAISNATAVDILGQASHCTCEMHFCWGYSKCSADHHVFASSILLDNTKALSKWLVLGIWSLPTRHCGSIMFSLKLMPLAEVSSLSQEAGTQDEHPEVGAGCIHTWT